MIKITNKKFLISSLSDFVSSHHKLAYSSICDPKEPKKGSSSSSSSSSKPGRRINSKFDDPIIAFKSKTTWELIRAYLVYQMTSIRPLVEHNMAIMKFSQKVVGKGMFAILMRMSFYGHFVAGEDEKEIAPLLQRMYSFGVGTILDYSVEEDLSNEEAESREKEALKDPGTDLPQFKVDPLHMDRRENVVSARTYFYADEGACDRNMEVFLRCIECISSSTYNTGLVAIKLTALCKPKLLLQISEVIAKSRMYLSKVDQIGDGHAPVIQHHVSADKLKQLTEKSKAPKVAEKFLESVTSDSEGLIHLFPWSGILNDEFEVNETFQVPDPVTGEMTRLMAQLTPEEEKHFKNMIRRVNTVMRAAAEMNVGVMVDAEQTYFQPAISRLTLEMMRKFNKGRGIVYNTYQNYLLSSYDEIVSDLEQARRQDFYFRCKLVRGAYIEQERERAKDLNYPDPTQPSFEATTESYHKALMECLRRIKVLKDEGVKEKKVAIMVASHNEDTVRLAIEKMQEVGIEPEEGTIMFGQLFGMCDFISYSLADANYSIYKYTPYGPVNEVMPYLSRRATENKGVLKNVQKEKSMLAKEIFRRALRFQLNLSPQGPKKPPK